MHCLNSYTILLTNYLQVYTRLNHLNVSLSYNATLAAVTEVSKLHKVPLQQWIAEGVTFKFVGDNVDKSKEVRDIRLTTNRSCSIYIQHASCAQSCTISSS